MTDINCDNPLCTTAQQDIGETAGRSTHIERDLALHVECTKVIKRSGQLVPGSRNVINGFEHL
jgi:hypothetical protein